MLKGAVLYVKNLENMVAFFSALGGDVSHSEPGEFATLTSSGTELILLQVPEHIAAAIEITAPPAIRSGTPIKPILLVASIPEALEVLPKTGGMKVPEANIWEFQGHLIQDIVDPEGNVIQLWQPATA